MYMEYQPDCGFFNLRCLRAKTKVAQTLMHELLFADDCTIMAHTLEHYQKLTVMYSVSTSFICTACVT